MNFKLNLPYSQAPVPEGQTQEKPLDTSVNIINYAIVQAYKDGLDGNGPVRRIYGRLQRKLDKALNEKADSIDLEQGEIDMIKKALHDGKLPVAWSKHLLLLEDELDNGGSEEVAPAPTAA